MAFHICFSRFRRTGTLNQATCSPDKLMVKIDTFNVTSDDSLCDKRLLRIALHINEIEIYFVAIEKLPNCCISQACIRKSASNRVYSSFFVCYRMFQVPWIVVQFQQCLCSHSFLFSFVLPLSTWNRFSQSNLSKDGKIATISSSIDKLHLTANPNCEATK